MLVSAGSRPYERGWRLALLLLWLPAVYFVTLGPTPPAEGEPALEGFAFCLLCGERGGADLLLNVAFFVPLGLVSGRRLGLPGAFFLGAAMAAAIELLQLAVPGRYSTLADVLSNGAGSLLGAALYRGLASLASGAALPPSVGATLAAGVGCFVLVGGWLLAPAPTPKPYWGQWTPELGGARYGGTVLEARFDGRPFPRTRFPPDSDPARALRSDWALSGTVIKGPPPGQVVSVLSISDGDGEEILYLGAYQEHLLLRERLRAQEWRLHRPELVAPDALATAGAGDTLDVSARRAGADRCLAVNGAEVCGLAFTPGRLWSLLTYSTGASRWMQRVADAALIVLLFLPLGVCAPSWRAAGANGLVAAALMAAAVAWTRLVPDFLVESVAALGGLALGVAAAATLRHWGAPGRRDEPLSPATEPSAPASHGSA